MLNNNSLYAAFMAKDARFDGRFFVGIRSTWIYCRPVCRAKRPKAENCAFYSTAAAAEQAGFRPCLLCRPELAPSVWVTDTAANLVHRAARMLEESCGFDLALEKIATRLGCTARHLRRAFAAEYKTPPVRYLQTCRLLLAKHLLTDTDLPVLDVAMAAGFGSLRRFNALFRTRYQLSPTALRKRAPSERERAAGVSLALSYHSPYRWEEILDFLAARAIAGVEVVKDGEYMRTVQLEDATGKLINGWIRVAHKPKINALGLTVSETLLPVLPLLTARVRCLFDLRCDPFAVYETLRIMNDIRPGLCILGTRVPGCFNVFEMAVRAVLGQQITIRAAGILATRIAETYGVPIQTGSAELTRIFPSPEDVLALGDRIEELFGVLGVTGARSRAIRELACACVHGNLNLPLCIRPEETMKTLMSINGIGAWTAQYIAMRAMEWPDIFLETDAGVKKALRPYSSKERLALAENWRPWRSYATINLWNSLTQ